MTHLRPVNQKAARIAHEAAEARRRAAQADGRVVALQDGPAAPPKAEGPHIPMGCSFVFYPGWEVDANGGTAGLCQPVERDLFDCHLGCFWAGAGAGPVESCAGLDQQVRGGAEGLAEG